VKKVYYKVFSCENHRQ